MNEQAPDGPSTPSEMNDDAPLAIKSGADGQSLHVHVERDIDLASVVCKFYHEDPMFSKILVQPEAHPSFGIKQNLIWTKNQMNCDVVCLPRKAFLRGRRLVEVILDHTHTSIGHFGQSSTSWYIHRYYWWPAMGTDIESFCRMCPSCQITKEPHKRPEGSVAMARLGLTRLDLGLLRL